MGKATIYDNAEDAFAIIAPCSSCGYYHIFALKRREDLTLIKRKRLAIGSHVFEPGHCYDKFGIGRNTSASYITYHGTPIQFYGTYEANNERHALFTNCGEEPFSSGGKQLDMFDTVYPCCFWSWKFSIKSSAFFGLTSAQSARQMEM
jgi:hypothetical protein